MEHQKNLKQYLFDSLFDENGVYLIGAIKSPKKRKPNEPKPAKKKNMNTEILSNDHDIKTEKVQQRIKKQEIEKIKSLRSVNRKISILFKELNLS